MHKVVEWARKDVSRAVAAAIVLVLFALLFGFPQFVAFRFTAFLFLSTFTSYFLHRRWWMPVLSFLVAGVLGVYAVGGHVLLSSLSAEPARNVVAPLTPVLPGGEGVSLKTEKGQPVSSVVCFYVPDGPLVLAAHTLKLNAGDEVFVHRDRSEVVPSEGPESGTDSEYFGPVEVLAAGDYGALLGGIGPKASDKSEVYLATPSEVRVDELATILGPGGRTVSVRVAGYSPLIRNEHFLVVYPLDPHPASFQGFSGSPILQGDKIISFLYGEAAPFKGPVLLLTRPASEVYAVFARHFGGTP